MRRRGIEEETGRQFFRRLWEHDLVVFDGKPS